MRDQMKAIPQNPECCSDLRTVSVIWRLAWEGPFISSLEPSGKLSEFCFGDCHSALCGPCVWSGKKKQRIINFHIPAAHKLESQEPVAPALPSLNPPTPTLAWHSQDAAAPKGARGPGPALTAPGGSRVARLVNASARAQIVPG